MTRIIFLFVSSPDEAVTVDWPNVPRMGDQVAINGRWCEVCLVVWQPDGSVRINLR